MKFHLNRLLDTFKYNVYTHFCRYKFLYILTSILCLVFFIIGICVIFNKTSLNIDDIADKTLLAFLTHDSGVFGMIFSRIFTFVLLALCIWLTNFRPLLCILSFIIIIYRSFIIGTTCALLIKLFQFGGIINVVIIYLPFNLISLFLLISCCNVCVYHNFQFKRYGKHIICREFIEEKQDYFFLLGIILLICTILEIILFSIFSCAILIE